MRSVGYTPGIRAMVRLFGAAVVPLLAAVGAGGQSAPSDPPDAPELPTDPVLASLIEQSLAARPELAQARAEVAAERERVPQARALPDPMLQLGVQNDGFTSWEVGRMETSWYSIMATQTLPWPGRRRLRGQVTALGADQVEQNVARVRLSTQADVRRAYLSLVLARDRLALLDRLEAIWQKSEVLARTRYETGQGAQSDLLRAQLERNRIRQRRWGMQADAVAEMQTLDRLRGHALDEPIETSVHLVEIALPTLRDPDAIVQDALERSPELAAARLGVTQAERALALARRGSLPDFTVNVGVMPRGGDFQPMWLASVGVTLPVFARTKQGRAVVEREARLVASQRNAQAIEEVLRLRAAQRRTALGAMLEIIRLYRDGLLVQSEATADNTRTQYEVGKVTFASVLEANAGLVADQDGYLQALARAHRLAIDTVEVSLGPVPSSGSGMDSAAMPGAGQVSRPAPAPGAGFAAPSSAGGTAPPMSGM